MEALGVGVEQVVAALRSENQELPLGAHPLARAGARGADQRAAASAARTSATSSSRARRGRRQPVQAVAGGRRGRRPAGAGEPGALQRPAHGAAVACRRAQGENTIAVVDGLQRALAERAGRCCRRACTTEVNRDNSRAIRVSVANVQRTLLEGAALTVLIVFLFLNSWRSTVITGLTLPIALIGTFLFMYAVRLHDQHDHADGAEPVRGPADRRRHRRAREHRAPRADGQERARRGARRHRRDRPGGAGHHAVDRGGVPADRLHGRHRRQVLPRVRHHHRRPRC